MRAHQRDESQARAPSTEVRSRSNANLLDVMYPQQFLFADLCTGGVRRGRRSGLHTSLVRALLWQEVERERVMRSAHNALIDVRRAALAGEGTPSSRNRQLTEHLDRCRESLTYISAHLSSCRNALAGMPRD